jgi:hypothetical protein
VKLSWSLRQAADWSNRRVSRPSQQLVDLGRRVRPSSYAYFLAIVAAIVFVTHGSLLRIPFYWDELGQFVPASLDLFQLSRWIPVTTVPNIHPPGLMAYLAVFWHVTGYSIPHTRVAMLLLASLGAFFAFLLAIVLARGSAGFPAFTALMFLCLAPLFFAQAMMVQLDMPAMVLTCLALLLFLQDHLRRCAFVCVALVLVKETGIAAPIVFGFWLLLERRWKEALLFTAPLVPLGIWLFALHKATGSWAGNDSFAAYNAVYSLNPTRFLLALLRRLYYLFIGSGHFIGTIAVIYALRKTDLFRSRAWRACTFFVALHVLIVSLFGGAVLERYLLPALPLLYIAFAVALSALSTRWRLTGVLALFSLLIASNFINPIYPFPFENNLAYTTFVALHQHAADFVENSYPGGVIATTFPMAGALRRPAFGYVSKPLKVREIDNFQPASIASLAANPPDAIILYSVAWDPLGILRDRRVETFLHTYYGYEPQVTSDELMTTLQMHSVSRWTERGQWIEVFESDQIRHHALNVQATPTLP